MRVYECVLIPSREEGLEAFIKTQTDNALTLPLLLLMVSQSRVDSFSHVNPTTAFTLFPCKKNVCFVIFSMSKMSPHTSLQRPIISSSYLVAFSISTVQYYSCTLL